MKKIRLFIIISLCSLLLINASKRAANPLPAASADSRLAETLERLGDTPLPHRPNFNLPGVSAERGRELVLTGITTKPGGGKTNKQSKNFVCTACHNIAREDPDLRVSDPQARLQYVQAKGLPFVQGSPLYGVVNRTAFYNGFYEQKYGELVEPARNNLREAIQLCATQCSQGRRYENWELESVLAYLWTIDLKLGDLNLNDMDYQLINSALQNKNESKAAISLLQSKYQKASPATFAYPPDDRGKGYTQTGDPANGKLIYELSCLHCHEDGRFAFFRLDRSKQSFQYLQKHIPRYTRYSLYQVSRWGTSPVPGKHTYMPNYTAERLSNQQVEDLRAYIVQSAR